MNSLLHRPRILPILLLLGCLAAPLAHAQWKTQSLVLKPGWNAVYLHVDASHTTLDALINVGGNPITEVWQWQPQVSTLQFVDSPAQPIAPSSQWLQWDRSVVGTDSLIRLTGNAAYLVRNTNSANFTWTVTGKPLAPSYEWTTTGLNFLGFPTPTNAPPLWDTFLAPVPALSQNLELYRYPGGEANLAPPAPVRHITLLTSGPTNGTAFWMRSGTYFNRYFGPVQVEASAARGMAFGDSLGQSRLRLKNVTTTSRTVNLSLLASAAPPAGEAAILDLPPLLVRGALNATNLTYPYTVLATTNTISWTLAPQGQSGSEVEVVLGLNRSTMTNAAGTLYAGLLRFADTAGLMQVDLGVSATVGDNSGLWVGQANVTQVGSYLKSYQRDATGNLVQSTDTNNFGAYISTNTNTTVSGTARAFPLRLILHNNATNADVNLLQRVFVGFDAATNQTVAIREELLHAPLIAQARRISATHLPFSLANTPWPKSGGQLQLGTNVAFTVTLGHNDQASNPFLHTFHPDHDNLGTDSKTVQVQGAESYRVDRQMTLTFTPPANDFTSLTASTATLGGTYAEVITVFGKDTNTRQFQLAGSFSLNRLTSAQPLKKQ